LLWLAERTDGWGRVYVVGALCDLRDPVAYPWQLRKAVNGDILNGYFAGKVAITCCLHEAIDQFGSDPEFVDATSRLLCVMSECEGMGLTLGPYPHSGRVLGAHSRTRTRPALGYGRGPGIAHGEPPVSRAPGQRVTMTAAWCPAAFLSLTSPVSSSQPSASASAM